MKIINYASEILKSTQLQLDVFKRVEN